MPDAGPPGTDGTRLKRSVTGLLLFVFILGDVLGAGIYALVGVMAGEVSGALWVPFVLALSIALLTAGSYAELVTKYPRAGGAAIFAERAYRMPLLSFLMGFFMLCAGLANTAVLALAFADYLGTFVDLPPVPVAIAFIALIAAVNARGIRESLTGNLVMTAVEVTGLVIVIVAVAVLVGGGGGDVTRVGQFPDGATPALATLAAAIIAFFSFIGFETSANIAEEVREPSRVYPRALFGALLTAGVVYVLVGLASSIAVPAEDLAGSTTPLLDVVRSTGAGVPDAVFSAIALVAVANGALLNMIMTSRVTFGMAEQGLMPHPLARVLPRRGTPWVAIVATTAVAMSLTLVGELATLVETSVLLILVVFLSTNIAALVLRRDRVAHPHFRVWRAVPVLGALSCVALMTQQSGLVWLYGGGLLALGALIHFASRRFARRNPERESA